MDSCLLICLLLHLRAPLLQVTEGAQLHKVINESEVKTAQQQTDAQLQKCAAVGEALKHIKILENLLLEARFCKGNFTYMASTIQTFVFSIKSRNFPGFSLSSDEQKLSKQISSSKKKGHAMSFPPALLEGVRQRTEEHRFICIYINTSCAFQNENNNTLLNNYILGATLRNTSVRNLSHPVEMRFWHDRVLDNSTATCVFWLEEAESDSRGTWSREGCKTIHERHMVLCQCNHLTYFAVLLQNSSEDINENLLAPLTYITIIGCSISAAASLLTILLYLVSRKKKGDNTTKIHMNLLGGLFFLNGFFLLSEPLASFNLMWLCRTAAVFLHYSLLCCFTWMAIEGFHLYLLLIKVYNVYIRRYIHKLCMLGWGLPAIIVIGILIAKKEVYGFHQIKTSGHNYTATMYVLDHIQEYPLLYQPELCWGHHALQHSCLSHRTEDAEEHSQSERTSKKGHSDSARADMPAGNNLGLCLPQFWCLLDFSDLPVHHHKLSPWVLHLPLVLHHTSESGWWLYK